MLKANVGLSRKLSKDFNSAGFSVNLEGEITATLDDPEAVIERIKELYSVAEEALDRQVAEGREIEAIASRDAEPPPRPGSKGHPDGLPALESTRPPSRNGHRDEKAPVEEPASNKQVAYLQTLARRRKLNGPGLEAFIAEAIGRRCTPYDLTKKEAGAVIDALNPEDAGENPSRR